jgi:hypothetical protein
MFLRNLKIIFGIWWLSLGFMSLPHNFLWHLYYLASLFLCLSLTYLTPYVLRSLHPILQGIAALIVLLGSGTLLYLVPFLNWLFDNGISLPLPPALVTTICFILGLWLIRSGFYGHKRRQTPR